MSFKDLARQVEAVEQLQRSVRRGRLAHAYLFLGRGDKTTELVARTLVQALNCQQQTDDACGRCDSCRRVQNDAHPDVHWVGPESKSRRIETSKIREFESEVYLKPRMARVKVGVIVDADCMTEEASNAFLKTLEEPPDQTIIILLSSKPERLLPTILSRCLRINFGSAPEAGESRYREPVVRMLLEAADGIVGAYQLHSALTSLLQQRREEIHQRVWSDVPMDWFKDLEKTVRDRLEKETEARIEGEYRGERDRFLAEIYAWHLDILLCAAGADPRLLEHPDQLEALRRAAARLTVTEALQKLEAIEQIRDTLERNASETLALEVGLLKLARRCDPQTRKGQR